MLNWYVIKTKPKQEDLAAATLSRAGLEILNPKIKQLEKIFGSRTWVERPLFPCYIFSLFDVRASYRRVRYASGVQQVVSFGQGPIPVDEKIISVISRRLDSKGCFEVERFLNEGDVVEIMEGPLEGFVGVLDHQVGAGERVAVLLNTVSFQPRVLIESDQVQRSLVSNRNA
jgi:transcriptional antiterminator RfaH